MQSQKRNEHANPILFIGKNRLLGNAERSIPRSLLDCLASKQFLTSDFDALPPFIKDIDIVQSIQFP